MGFLGSERIRLEMPQTTITERAMTSAPFRVTVTAREEQIPRTSTVMGLPLKIGFRMVSFSFASMAYSSSHFFSSHSPQQCCSHAGSALFARKYLA